MERLKLFCVYFFDDVFSVKNRGIKTVAFSTIWFAIISIFVSSVGLLLYLPYIGLFFYPFWLCGWVWTTAAWWGNILLGWIMWPVILFAILENFGKTFYFPEGEKAGNGGKKYLGRVITFSTFKAYLMYVSAILGISLHLLVMPIVNYVINYPLSHYNTSFSSTLKIKENFRTYSYLPYFNSKNDEFLRVLGLTGFPEGRASKESVIMANQLCKFGKISKIVCKEIVNEYDEMIRE